jgi:hypothetical protein
MAEFSSNGTQSSFWQTFVKSRTFLPPEHGSWVLFVTPLAVGGLVGRNWNWPVPVMPLVALALFLSRQPLDLALKTWRGKRPGRDLPAVLAWLAIDGLVGLVAGAYLLWATRLWGLVVLGAAALALMILQLWALQTRLHRTAWIEVLGTLGLGLGGAGMYYVARGAWSPTVLALALLPALQGAGGVLYARWRLRQRRLFLQHKDVTKLARSNLLIYHATSLAVAIALAETTRAPWSVVPLYLLLLLRAAWGMRRTASPARSVQSIGAAEGVVTLISAAWVVLAFLAG